MRLARRGLWPTQIGAWGAAAAIRVAVSERLANALSGPRAAEAALSLAAWALGGLAVSSGLGWVYLALPERALRGGRLVATLVLGSLTAALVWTVALQAAGASGGWAWLGARSAAAPWGGFANRIVRATLLFGVIGGAFVAVLLAGRVAEAREQALKADALLQVSRLDALRYQLNPHFLFNALGSLVALVDEDPARAQDMLRALGRMLRRTLASGDPIVPVREEIEHVRLYLGFEAVRFEEKLEVRYEVAGEILNDRVPAMLLLPLVDNAVKHGMKGGLPLRIAVRGSRENERVVLAVSNTGRLVPAEKGAGAGGVGLTNVRERLQATCPRSQRFDLTERDAVVTARIEYDPREIAPGP